MVKGNSEAATVNGVRKFGWTDKIGYALGDFGCNLSFALIGTYMMDFYTQFIGLSSGTWAILIILVKVWDAINDPIMGGIIDSKRIGKKSKFKPWIKIGAIGLTVTGALAFLPIPGAPYAVKVTVCILTYLLWDICYTLVNVPYGSLNSAISADPNERTALSTWRSIGAGLGGLVMLVLPVLVYDEDNVLLGDRFIWIGLVLGFLAFWAFFACLKMTEERYEKPAEVKQKYNYLNTLKGFFKNRPLIAMCIASFAMIVFFWSNQQTTKWLFQCYFGNAKLSGIASIASYLPLVVSIPFVGKAVKRWGKKAVAGFPLLLSVVSAAVLLLIPMQPNDMTSTIIYMVGMMLIQLGGGAFQLICWAMITDCIDYQELKTKRREEGSVYAMYSLFRKLAQGVAASLVIMCMTWVGYNADLGPDQLAGVPEKMKNMAIILMLVGSALMAVSLLLLYNLGKKQVAKIGEELNKSEQEIDINEALENSKE
jgi:GPH family glycoside/pentoside/hexuronide:cation symporter